MNESKTNKTNKIIATLIARGHFVEIKANGHIKVGHCNFWCTTEKWYDETNNVAIGGKGLESFISHIESKNKPIEAQEGLKIKYNVYKIKDSTPVYDCFVLRPTKDKAALYALKAYAYWTKNKELAADISKWVQSIEDGLEDEK